MCLAIDFRNTAVGHELLVNLFRHFEKDVDMLVFAPKETLVDLKDNAMEKLVLYHEHPDAKLPQAYLHLLAKVSHHRNIGHIAPYGSLDPMLSGNPILFTNLEIAWETKSQAILSRWKRIVIEVKIVSEEYDNDFWGDVSFR